MALLYQLSYIPKRHVYSYRRVLSALIAAFRINRILSTVLLPGTKDVPALPVDHAGIEPATSPVRGERST